MSLYTLFSGIICGLFVLSGGFSLFLYFRRIERSVNLSYFALAVTLVGVISCNVAGVYVGDVTGAVLIEQWLNTFFLLAGIAMLVMISLMTGYRNQWAMAILTAASVLLLIANWLLPYGITFDAVTGIQRAVSIWGEEHVRLRGVTGNSNILSILLILALMLYCLLAVRHDFRQGNRRHALRLSIVLIIAFGGVLIDTVLLERNVATIGIIDDLGFIAFAFMIAYRTFDGLLRSNELIRESRERALHLTEAAFEGIAFIENGLVLDVNEQLAEMFGYRPIEMIGRPVTDFVPAVAGNEIPEGERILDGHTYQYQARRHDGSTLPIEVRVKTITRRNRVVRVTAIR
ncbi:MAG: PAS domain-containing protein, partial [Bacteroidetes bacterium]|nr:PAS domain-containing protein [Bacteroidota bacterium]